MTQNQVDEFHQPERELYTCPRCGCHSIRVETQQALDYCVYPENGEYVTEGAIYEDLIKIYLVCDHCGAGVDDEVFDDYWAICVLNL